MIPKLYPALVLLLVLSVQSWAAPGDLDLAFGIAGKSMFPVGKVSADQGRAAALQPDGKIVVVGDSVTDGAYSGEVLNLIVTRLNPNGTRDISFGTAGVVVLRLREPVNATAVVLQPDGKILVGG